MERWSGGAAVTLSDIRRHGNRGATHVGRKPVQLFFWKGKRQLVRLKGEFHGFAPDPQISIVARHGIRSLNQ